MEDFDWDMMMSQPVFEIFRQGKHYMQTWPMQKELYALFPECRVISATRFAINVMPPMAVLSAFILVSHLGLDYLPQAIAIGAFFISLPMQGLMWLGHRSQQPLPPAIKSWYLEIHHKMRGQGCHVHAVQANPKFMELARLLKTAFSELDKVFTKEWF